ncbi:MAG: efflux RND transporter periplasmic adaptor subunit [Flavobacteriaceae bacterium]
MKPYKNKYILIALTLILFQCKNKEEVREEVLRPVKYMTVGEAPTDQIREFTGTAKAGNEIELSFRETGVIQRVNVKKGQRVSEGSLIASLDNVESNLNYQKSLTELRSAESAMNTSKAEFDRVKTLYEKGSTALKDYQSARNNYQATLSQYEAAIRSSDLQKSRIGYGFIYAPSDGIIASTEGKVNERVQTGHIFAILNAGDKKKVELELAENVINRVLVGMSVQVLFSTLPDQTFIGTVIEISPITSSNSATYPVDIEIENPTEQILPGMAARVSFNFADSQSDRPDAIIAPIKAVGEDNNGNFVFLVETEDNLTGTVRRTSVEIGEVTAGGFEIESGLEPGQLIATAGLQTLLDGQKVKLK